MTALTEQDARPYVAKRLVEDFAAIALERHRQERQAQEPGLPRFGEDHVEQRLIDLQVRCVLVNEDDAIARERDNTPAHEGVDADGKPLGAKHRQRHVEMKQRLVVNLELELGPVQKFSHGASVSEARP